MKFFLSLLILCVGTAGLITLRGIDQDGAPFGCAVLLVLFGLLIVALNYLG